MAETQAAGSDHRNIVIPNHASDPDLKGFQYHSERKDELGLTWLEYINAQAPAGSADPEAIADAVVAEVDFSGEVDIDPSALSEVVADAVARCVEPNDIRQAAYEGAKEAMQEAETQTY